MNRSQRHETSLSLNSGHSLLFAGVRKLCCLVFSLASLSTTTLWTQPTAPKTATFTSSTELVLIPTIVHDKSGSHISGLAKSEFSLKQDGKNQPIAVFEEVKTSSERAHRSGVGQETFSNFEPGTGGYHRLSIIVLDFVNTPFSDLANARQALLKFLLESAESGEPICLLTLNHNGLNLVHNFTDDSKLLAQALRNVTPESAPATNERTVEAGHPPPNDKLGAAITKLIRDQLQTEAQLNSLVAKDQALITVQGLQQVAKAFGGFPGRKALIWTSSGFPFSLSSPATLMCEPACPMHQRTEVQSAYDNLWKMMNDAQIAIYAVDLRAAGSGIAVASGTDFTHPYDVGDPQFDTDAQAKWKLQDTSSTLQLFAENTGGKAFLGGNNLGQSFRQAIQDDSSYYMLGYYAAGARPGWHDVSVAVHARGANVRYRKGFFLSRDASSATARQDIQLALSSPLDYTGIPIAVTWSGTEPGKLAGKTRMQFELVMPANFALVDESDQNHMVLDIAAVARNSKGDMVANLSQRVEAHVNPAGLGQIQHNGMTYRNGLQLPPGEYSVRFVVRDSLGNRMGSVAAPLKVAP